ncbi:MAG: hypothetical protein FWE01_00650 [Firmicutes bacterium]|nr:hypothetical protein [Bacillota bacterium]
MKSFAMERTNENSLQAQLIVHPEKNLTDKEVITFDKVIEKSGAGICMNRDGIFRLCTAGVYLVNWNISVNGTNQRPFVRFALMVNGQIRGPSSRPTSVGEISGSNIVTVKRTPTEIALVNDTGDIVQLSEVSPIANITIVQVNSTLNRRFDLCQHLFNLNEP